MAEAETLNVKKRETRGKRNARRMRQEGAVPAVLYGHGEETIALAVPTDQLDAALRHNAQLVSLEGDVKQQAIIRELQWDVYATHVLHVDFTRVDRHELVEVTVPVELMGEAPGVREGGSVEQLIHEVTIECPAIAIPENLTVNINELHLDQSISLSELELPKGAKLTQDDSETIVQCREVLEAPEELEPEVGESAEPEMIGRKEDEDQESGENAED